MTLNNLNNGYSTASDNTWALGHHCETSNFYTFWISYWNLKYFKFIFIWLWKSFRYKSGSSVLKFASTQSKWRSNQCCDHADWPFSFNLASFLFLFAAANFKSFRHSLTTCSYNPCSVAIRLLLFFSSIDTNLSLFLLSLHCLIKSYGNFSFL